MSDHDTLTARIDSLEAAVAALTARLAESEPGRFRSMRESRRCPACGSGALLQFHGVEAAIANGTGPMSLVQERLSLWRQPKAKGPLGAFACRTCNLVEWHARDLEGIVVDGVKVIQIDPEPAPASAGPFR